MRYSVLLEAVQDPELPDFHFAHIPALDLTTHGQGVEGALATARDLVEVGVTEKQAALTEEDFRNL